MRAIRDAIFGHTDLAAEADKAAGGPPNKLKFFDEWFRRGEPGGNQLHDKPQG